MTSYMKFAALALGLGFFAPGTVMAQNAGANAAPVTQGETPITITVGDTVMTGRLNSTVMARHLADRLPMTVDFGNHSISGDDFPTKVHRIEPPLPTEGTVLGGRPGVGEIAHYVPNGNLGFYYGQLASSWPGVVSLGTFDGDPKVFERRSESTADRVRVNIMRIRDGKIVEGLGYVKG